MDIENSDWENSSENESNESEVDDEEDCYDGNDRDIWQHREILNRLLELKEQGEEDGIDEKILEVEQTI